MSITIEAQATRTLIQQDGVSRVAFNDNGSMEILTPTSNPTGNLVPTAGQVLGFGQTWQNLTASRVIGTTYTNTTGKPIVVNISISQGSAGVGDVYVSDVIVGRCQSSSTVEFSVVSAIVPNGATYRYTIIGGSQTLGYWSELR